MIRDIAKAVERTLPYFTSAYNLISLVVMVTYGMVRLQNGIPLGRNTLLLCACTVFTRWLRAPNSLSATSSTLIILKGFVLVDSYFSFDNYEPLIVLLSVFVTVWLMIDQDSNYRGKASHVSSVTSISDYGTGRSLVFFFDPKLNACRQFTYTFAELSACSNNKFFLVDVSLHPEIAVNAKVFVQSQPVLVQYVDGTEINRFPLDTTKQASVSNPSANLDRAFWFTSIRKRFSL